MTATDDLPQNICPFCSQQIKTTYYFILKCQESDRKLRLSLSNCAAKSVDEANVNDEFIDNDAADFESIVGEDTTKQIDSEKNELNREMTIMRSKNGATAKTSKYILLKSLSVNSFTF